VCVCVCVCARARDAQVVELHGDDAVARQRTTAARRGFTASNGVYYPPPQLLGPRDRARVLRHDAGAVGTGSSPSRQRVHSPSSSFTRDRGSGGRILYRSSPSRRLSGWPPPPPQPPPPQWRDGEAVATSLAQHVQSVPTPKGARGREGREGGQGRSQPSRATAPSAETRLQGPGEQGLQAPEPEPAPELALELGRVASRGRRAVGGPEPEPEPEAELEEEAGQGDAVVPPPGSAQKRATELAEVREEVRAAEAALNAYRAANNGPLPPTAAVVSGSR
jgi:hypothetical protein